MLSLYDMSVIYHRRIDSKTLLTIYIILLSTRDGLFRCITALQRGLKPTQTDLCTNRNENNFWLELSFIHLFWYIFFFFF